MTKDNFSRFLNEVKSKSLRPLGSLKSKFKKIDLKFYGFLTLIFFPFYKSQNSRVFKELVKFDQILFKYRIFQIFAWSVLIKAEKN